jgi:hypothetical protein
MGEIHICQRKPGKLRKWFMKAKRNVGRQDAIAEAQRFVQEILRLLKKRSTGKDIIRVVMKYVCSLPSSRADRGITDADRESPACTAVDAEASEDVNAPAIQIRAGRPLDAAPEDVVTVMDVAFETTGEEEGKNVAEDITYVADESSIPIDIEKEREAYVTEGPAPTIDGPAKEGEGSPSLAMILGAVAGVLAVSGCGIFAVLKHKQKRCAAFNAVVNPVVSPSESVDVGGSFRKVPGAPEGELCSV